MIIQKKWCNWIKLMVNGLLVPFVVVKVVVNAILKEWFLMLNF